MKTIIYAILATVCTLFAWLWWNDRGLILGKEEMLMKKWSAFALSGGKTFAESPKDFIFINTANDLQLTEAYENIDGISLPIGNAAITDRRKLTQLFQLLSNSPDYKYIFLDIILEKQFSTPHDSTLAMAINSTPRLVYASNNTSLIDNLKPEKAGQVTYTTTMVNGDFCKYNLMEGNLPSMVYKAYCDLHPEANRRIPKSFMPVLYFNKKHRYAEAKASEDVYTSEIQILQLGEDVLSPYSDFSKVIKDKYIFIGVFDSYDTHPTYLDRMDGIQIHANALLNLLNGNHVVHPIVLSTITAAILIFYLLLFTRQKRMVRATVNPTGGSDLRKKMHRLIDRTSVRLIFSFLTIELIFVILFYFIFLATERIVEITSLSLLFTILWNLPGNKIYIICKPFIAKLMKKIKSINLLHPASILGILIIFCACAYGESYRILYISTPQYLFFEKGRVMAGDTVTLNDIPKWSSSKQIIKAQRLSGGSYEIFQNSPSIKGKNLPLKKFLISKSQMAGRGDTATTPDALRANIPDTLLLLDKIEIPTTIKQNSSKFFFIEYNLEGDIIKKKLPLTEGMFTIDRSIYSVDGNDIPAFKVPIHIFYYDSDANIISIVGENKVIVPLDL